MSTPVAIPCNFARVRDRHCPPVPHGFTVQCPLGGHCPSTKHGPFIFVPLSHRFTDAVGPIAPLIKHGDPAGAVPATHSPSPKHPSAVAPHSDWHVPAPQSAFALHGFPFSAPAPTHVPWNEHRLPSFAPPTHFAPVNWNTTVDSTVQFAAHPSPPNP
jgi:hypothetical protein